MRFAAALALCYIVMPPGFCPCRLQAAFFSAHPCDEPADHEDSHDDCHCGQPKAPCLLAAAPALPPLDLATAVLLTEPPIHGEVENAFTAFASRYHSSDQPIYLTLRALLI